MWDLGWGLEMGELNFLNNDDNLRGVRDLTEHHGYGKRQTRQPWMPAWLVSRGRDAHRAAGPTSQGSSARWTTGFKVGICSSQTPRCEAFHPLISVPPAPELRQKGKNCRTPCFVTHRDFFFFVLKSRIAVNLDSAPQNSLRWDLIRILLHLIGWKPTWCPRVPGDR